MGKLKFLTSHPRFALHGLYFLLSFLVVIFYIFSAVSGPGTKYYWIKITLRADSKTGEAGAIWGLGGLGSCDTNKKCNDDAPHAQPVRRCLRWHLALSIIFAILSTIQAVFVLKPMTSLSAIVKPRLTLCLPPLTFIPVLLTLIADFAIRASIDGSDDVEKVETQSSFWLSTAGTIIAFIWVFVAEYVMWKEHKNWGDQADAEGDGEDPKKAGHKGFVARLWPWGA